jgi:hypothetical protein
MTNQSPNRRPRVRRLIGVHNANGTLSGEVAYWIGARLGRTHCALCDITHGSIRERDDWKTCRATLPVAFDTYHRNDLPDDIRALARSQVPTVIAETDQGLRRLLGPDELNDCDGSPEQLLAAIDRAVEQHNLVWPT